MNIAVTGYHGFIGSKLAELLSVQHQLFPMGKQENVDITKPDTIQRALEKTNTDIILHLAAYTNVDEAEKQKSMGKNSPAYQTNVIGAQNIARAAKQHGKKLIHISTDMVFGGIEQDFYHEKDMPFPVNFYGMTKFEGEQNVLASNNEAAVLRIAYPYTFLAVKRDYVRIFIQYFKEKKAFSSVADCFYTPTYIDDIATSLSVILEKNLSGILHGTSEEKLSGYEIAQKIADKFGFDKSLVTPTTRQDFFKDRAPRSKNTALANDTLHSLGIQLHTLAQALDEFPKELLT